MTAKPKPWPYLAADVRDRAAEEATTAIRILEPMAEMEGDIERLRKQARILAALYRITRLLESVGANTRP